MGVPEEEAQARGDRAEVQEHRHLSPIESARGVQGALGQGEGAEVEGGEDRAVLQVVGARPAGVDHLAPREAQVGALHEEHARNPPGGMLQPGQTWNFQTWVRISGSSRFTPALSVTFDG